MNFLKKFTEKVEKATKNMRSENTPPGKIKRDPGLDDAYSEFEDRYFKSCEKREAKIYNVEVDNLDPDKNVAGFNKMLELCHELEEFCNSHGPGGAAYFKENYFYIYQEIRDSLDDYMKNEYEEAKIYFEEEKARQKAIKGLASKILKAIQNEGGSVMQKDLRKQFPKNEPDYFNQAIKSLLEAGKIAKFKDGNFVGYKIL